MSDNIKVAVRVRPFNKRELNVDDAKCIISMKGNATTIQNIKLEGRIKDKQFFYDHSIWSFDHNDPNFVSQSDVFDKVGRVALSAAFEGYNACIFAYGQTGSGKSYTMMGTVGDDKEEGLIPRLCNTLFAQIELTENESIQFKTEVSYYEIYNEKVHDLLAAGNKNSKQVLRVREHPKDGPYVENLTSCLVSDSSAITEWMDYGNSHRSTAATMMNQRSSRSHAIFTIKMTMAQMQEEGPSEIISKMHLIDLAGSERAATSGATGERLKEGGNINKSLVTLGLVISKLAEETKSIKGPFVPYRDSVLTRLLKDSLGGNSKTFLIATISPSELNYPETLSTLYFADSAKKVKNKPEVNEDPNVKLIKDLKMEIENLRQFIHVNQLQGDDSFLKEHDELKSRLLEKEGKINDLSKAWTVKWQEMKKVIEDREMAITSNGLKLYLGSQLPHLIELNARSSQPGLVMYHIKKGIIKVGKSTNIYTADIELDLPDIMQEHCQIEYEEDIMLIPGHGRCAVNKKIIKEPVKLYNGDTLLLGRACVLKFYNPQQRTSVTEQPPPEDISDPEESLLSNSPPNQDIIDLSVQADLALSRADEDKDREIERLNRQVRDLQDASNRYQDQVQGIGETMSREFSIEDEVFSTSARNSASGEIGIYFDRFDGGAVITQPYNGSLGTSPFHRMSLISDTSGEEDTGIFTENELHLNTTKSSSNSIEGEQRLDKKQISLYFGGTPSTSSDDVNTPTVNKTNLVFVEPVSLQPWEKRVSMMDVEKMISHEKRKIKHEYNQELFKLHQEREEMQRQISTMQRERASHVAKSRVRLGSLTSSMRRDKNSLIDQVIITCAIPFSHLVKKSIFSGTFHIYHVQIDVRNEGVINVYRRYNEFRHLHDEVNLQYSELEEMFEFPPRRFIGNKAPTFVAQRKTLLETYLGKVLTYLSCKKSCSIATFNGELPTKETMMDYHKFFFEDETDKSLHINSTNVPVHHVN